MCHEICKPGLLESVSVSCLLLLLLYLFLPLGERKEVLSVIYALDIGSRGR